MGKVIVFEQLLNDAESEDPELYAAVPLHNWEVSEAGKWVMQHSKYIPSWDVSVDHNTFQYKVRVIAELSEQDFTFLKLKF